MSRPETRPDWRGWLALAWAIGFGVLYARMVLHERAPGLLRVVERFADASLGLD